MNQALHRAALDAALAGDWQQAHEIVQALDDPPACWIHAILHKLEGDAGNARYWYARSGGRTYEDFVDPHDELEAVLALVEDG